MKTIYEKNESEIYSELRTLSNISMTAVEALYERYTDAHNKGQHDIAVMLSAMHNELLCYIVERRLLCRQRLVLLEEEAQQEAQQQA